jgi:hypothetical protein
MKDEKEFYAKFKERDPDLLLKAAKSVIKAARRRRPKITIFEVTFKDGSELSFNIEQEEYLAFLNSLVEDLVKMDEPEVYLLCAEIIKLSKPKRKYTKNASKQEIPET